MLCRVQQQKGIGKCNTISELTVLLHQQLMNFYKLSQFEVYSFRI